MSTQQKKTPAPDLVENARIVLEMEVPEHVVYGGKGGEPEWFQKWVHEKIAYIKAVAAKYGYLPHTIMYWKMEKIKEAFPL